MKRKCFYAHLVQKNVRNSSNKTPKAPQYLQFCNFSGGMRITFTESFTYNIFIVQRMLDEPAKFY